jgi:hypothetical protein
MDDIMQIFCHSIVRGVVIHSVWITELMLHMPAPQPSRTRRPLPPRWQPRRCRRFRGTSAALVGARVQNVCALCAPIAGCRPASLTAHLAITRAPQQLQKPPRRAQALSRRWPPRRAGPRHEQLSDAARALLAPPKLTAKNAALARQVRLLKIKGKAAPSRDVPEERRVFLEVTFVDSAAAAAPAAAASASGPAYLCVDRRHVVGRVIDAAAKALKVANSNAATADPAQRLHLYVHPASLPAASTNSNPGAAPPEMGVAGWWTVPLAPDAEVGALEAAQKLENGGAVVLVRGLVGADATPDVAAGASAAGGAKAASPVGSAGGAGAGTAAETL